MTGLDDLSKEDINTQISDISLYVVVLSRIIYSGAVAAGITYTIGRFGLRWTLPSIETLQSLDMLWVGMYAVVALLVVGIGYRVWVVLSWSTAYVLCPSVRAHFHEVKQAANIKKRT